MSFWHEKAPKFGQGPERPAPLLACWQVPSDERYTWDRQKLKLQIDRAIMWGVPEFGSWNLHVFFFTAKIDGIHGGGWWFIPKESGTVLLWEVWIILDIFGSIFIRWRVVLSQHENSRTIRSFASHELYVTCHLGSATHGQFAMLHSVWIETS